MWLRIKVNRASGSLLAPSAGRARREPSVITGQKNDVNVNLFGPPPNLSSKGAKNRNYLRLNGLYR